MTGSVSPVCRIVPAGDAAIIAELDARIDPAVNARAIALARLIRDARLRGVRDVVSTFRSVAVYFDPLTTDYDALVELIRSGATRSDEQIEGDRPAHRIPVVYGGVFGPDLPDVAASAGLTEEEAVALHTARTYRVFTLGFMPGWAYMSEVDGRIALPRLGVPRVGVPAGSVAIAGGLTGVYPFDAPGGWRIIGRTPVKPYDPASESPCLFQPGDSVTFVRIDEWPK